MPLFLTVTTPELTAKLSELNDATPLLDVVASSPATVIVLPDTDVSIPSPAVIVNVSPRLTALAVPEEAAMLM